MGEIEIRHIKNEWVTKYSLATDSVNLTTERSVFIELYGESQLHGRASLTFDVANVPIGLEGLPRRFNFVLTPSCS